jgi:hypothetical protein
LKNAVGFTGTIRSPGPKSGTVLADFESSDYGDWVATGDAFGTGPARGAYSVQQLKGFRGTGLVNTYWKKGDGPTGTLTSQEFTSLLQGATIHAGRVLTFWWMDKWFGRGRVTTVTQWTGQPGT